MVGAALTDSAPGTTPRLTLATPERGARGHRRQSEGRQPRGPAVTNQDFKDGTEQSDEN